MTEKVSNCNVCGKTNFTHFNTTQFKGHQVVNVICEHCGFVFQSPRMTKSELNIFYTDQYRTMYQGDEGPSSADLNTQNARGKSLLKIISPIIKSIGIHLDIGSSAGELIKIVQNQYSNKGIGIEPGKAYRDFAIKQGVESFEEIDALPKNYRNNIDLISLGHVLEHLPEPIQYLENILRTLLKPNGYLLIEVPNLYFHDSFEVAHLSAFSPHSLKQSLRLAGFKIIHFKQHGNPRSKLFPLYLTVIATPATFPDKNIISEKFVASKRHLTILIRKVLSKILPTLAWLPKE